MTQKIVYSELGGPEVLTLVEAPTPVASAGEMLVRVEAAGVNPVDAKLRAGWRPSGPFDQPHSVGSDGAGVVVALGADVEGFRVGDPVGFIATPGAYATEVIVNAANATPRPPQVSAAAAAGIGIPFGTAYQSLRSLAVGPGDTLLVHAGSGAVGQAAIQFAVLWGATVIATASGRRFDRVRELGAVPVTYGEGLEDRVREVAPQGVTVILDCIGTDEAILASKQILADHSRIATIVRGADAPGFGIRAFSGGSAIPLTSAEQTWRQQALPVTMALLAAGTFSVELGSSYSLADAADAHSEIERGAQGKLTIVP